MTVRPTAIAVPLAFGAATALLLGVYASAHEPTGRDFVIEGFTTASAWKSAFASVAMFLFVMQVSLGLRITGRIGPRHAPPAWTSDLHRLLGTLAFGITLPVVFHCVWTVGYQSSDSRLVVHSIVGCIAYGFYVAKILAVRRDDLAPWAVPLTGSLLGVAMLVAWWTSALVHYAGGSS
ncbi:MAG: DUF6529 family protein [Acidimicrobiales bacterium]